MKNNTQIFYPKEGNRNSLFIEENSFWFKHRNDCICEAVKNFPPQGEIYDIGGGNGFVSLRLKNAGFTPILVEPGIEGAKNAQKRGLNSIICSTLENAGFRKKTLPAIGLFDVLEHIENDKKFLRTIDSLLISDGKLYITVPAYQFLWSNEDKFAQHFRRYSLKELSIKLKNSGFKINYETYFFSFLPIPIFLIRTLPSKLGLREITLKNEIQEHRKPKIKILNKIMEIYLNQELNKIKSGKKIHFGGSILIVASKL